MTFALSVDFLLGVILVSGIVAANVMASVRAIRDDGSTREQKLFQVALTWILPVLGAILVLMFTRQHPRTSSGQYRGTAEAIWDDLPVNHDQQSEGHHE